VEIYRALGGGWQVRIGAGADAPKVEIPQCPPNLLDGGIPLDGAIPLEPMHIEDNSPSMLPSPSVESWLKEPD